MHNSIKVYIEKLKEKTSKINNLYLRQFSELIKVIPIVGSWIESNTIGAINDSILEDRLNNLNDACSKALKVDDKELLLSEIANINNIFFVILLTNIEKISDQNNKIDSKIDLLVHLVQEQSTAFRPHSKFHFITISGASAVGKDCILDLIMRNKEKILKPIESLRKFTTRKKRIVDSKYYDFVSDEKFDMLEKSGQIIFPYYKRGDRYGFDRTHLYNFARNEGYLFCIFTHFESFPSDRQFLKNQGINHLGILLDSDLESLYIRSETRMLEEDDIEKRKKSIEKDFDFLHENKKMISNCFDLVLNNSDSSSKLQTYHKIIDAIGIDELAISS